MVGGQVNSIIGIIIANKNNNNNSLLLLLLRMFYDDDDDDQATHDKANNIKQNNVSFPTSWNSLFDTMT